MMFWLSVFRTANDEPSGVLPGLTRRPEKCLQSHQKPLFYKGQLCYRARHLAYRPGIFLVTHLGQGVLRSHI